MSSIASHINPTTTIASSRQQQTLGSTPAGESDPFAALLDALAADPNATTIPVAGQQSVQQGSAPAETQTAKGTTQPDATSNASGDNGVAAPATTAIDSILVSAADRNSNPAATAEITGNTVIATSTDTAPASLGTAKSKAATAGTANKLNTLLAVASHSATQAAAGAKAPAVPTGAANVPTANGATGTPSQVPAAPADPADTAKAALAQVDLANGDVATSDALTRSASIQKQAKSATDSAQTDTSAASTQNDATASVTDTGSGASPPNQAQQTAAAPAQPVAAAIAVGGPLATAAANAPAADKIIGDSTKARAKVALSSAGATNSQEPQAANDSAPANSAPTANKADAVANKQRGTQNDAANAARADSDAAQPSPAQADANSPAPAANGSAPAIADAASRIDTAVVATGTDISATPNAQTGSAETKADTAGMPNLGLSVANASAPSATVVAPAAAGTPGTVPVAGLAVAIASRAQAGSNQFDIRLDPPELGRIDVRLGVDRDGHVTSHVTVDRADTLQLLQDQQPQMQQALEQAGLKTADNGLQFSLRDQSFAGQNNNGGGPQQNTAQLVIPDADLPTVQSTQAYNRLGLGTGIDIRV